MRVCVELFVYNITRRHEKVQPILSSHSAVTFMSVVLHHWIFSYYLELSVLLYPSSLLWIGTVFSTLLFMSEYLSILQSKWPSWHRRNVFKMFASKISYTKQANQSPATFTPVCFAPLKQHHPNSFLVFVFQGDGCDKGLLRVIECTLFFFNVRTSGTAIFVDTT